LEGLIKQQEILKTKLLEQELLQHNNSKQQIDALVGWYVTLAMLYYLLLLLIIYILLNIEPCHMQ